MRATGGSRHTVTQRPSSLFATLRCCHTISFIYSLPTLLIPTRLSPFPFLFRSTEETNKRLGKSRSKDKLRGPMQIFVDRMKLEDLEDSVLEQVDWFAAQDALPGTDEAVEFLEKELGMTPAGE